MTPDRAGAVEDRWHLQDQREFLVRSLADAEREHEAGDLSDEDFDVLRHRDSERLEEVDAALRELDIRAAVAGAPVGGVQPGAAAPDGGPAPGSGPGPARGPRAASGPARPPRRRRWLAIGGVAAILAAGVVVLVVHMTAPSLPGEDSSGSVALSSTAKLTQQLDEAAEVENSGHLLDALGDYQKILLAHPEQPQALAEVGWIEYELGVANKNSALAQDGQASVEHSIQLDPRAYAGHLYLGTIELEQDGDYDEAVEQYSEFLALDPPHKIVARAASYIRTAYGKAGVPVPSGL